MMQMLGKSGGKTKLIFSAAKQIYWLFVVGGQRDKTKLLVDADAWQIEGLNKTYSIYFLLLPSHPHLSLPEE